MTLQRRTGIAFALLSTVSVSAATQAQPMLEEVIVSAQKRDQSAQDVPIALSAFTADAIEQIGSPDFEGLQFFTPGLSVSGASGAFVSPYIRGIGTNQTSVGTDPSIGVYQDGIYLARKGGALSDLLDVQRVEILKGPQGTLFGRNAVGGAISITTARPVDTFEAEVGLGLGNYGGRMARGMVNAPITDNVTLRATLQTRQRDGWQENVINGVDGDDRDRTTGRVKLLWDASETFAIEIGGQWNETDEIARFGESIEAGLPVSELTRDRGDKKAVNDNINVLGDPAGSEEPTLPVFDRSMDLYWVSATWDLTPSLTLTSLSSYLEYETSAARDYDGTEFYIGNNLYNTAMNKTLSQEFRLSGTHERLDWFVGASYLQESYDMDFAVGFADFLGLNGGLPFEEDSAVASDTDSYAVYGDATWRFTDRWSLTFGARYSYDDKTIGYNTPLHDNGAAGLNGLGLVLATSAQFVNAQGLPDPAAAERSESWSDFSPRVVFDYRVRDDVMLYAGVTRGYKSGGFNTYPTADQTPGPTFLQVVPEATRPVDPETTLNYEAGIKSQFLNDRLLLNASVYAVDYEDLQVQVIEDQVVTLANAGKASSNGLEFDMKFRLSQYLTLFANGAWMDTEYDRFFRSGVDYSGTPLRFSPDFSGTLGADGAVQFADGSGLRGFISIGYKDEHNLDENFAIDSYTVVNARLTYRSADDAWQVALFGTNLGDEDFLVDYTEQTSAFGFTSAIRNEPRMYGAEITYRF